MAILFMDSFDHYGFGGDANARMVDNVYASVTSNCFPSTGQARTGQGSLLTLATFGQGTRRVFPTSASEVFVGFAFYALALPEETDRFTPCQLRDGSNNVLLSVVPLPDGSIAVRNGGLTSANVAVTSGPVIGAGAWNHIEVRAVVSTGTVEVRVNGVEVLSTTGFTFGANFAQWACSSRGAGGGINEYYTDDLIVNDTTGSYNNTWKGDLRIATLFPDEDGTPDGWSRNGRDKFGNGVFITEEGCLYVDDQTGFNIGSGDFTIEFFINFYALAASGEQTIAGQYRTDNNQRSWRLYLDQDSGGNLKFDISTDGTLGTVTTIIDWSGFQFEVGRFVFVSISRVSGTTYLHINGRLQGVGVSDSNTYHNSTGPLWVGTQLLDDGPNASTSVEADFIMDEFRFTVGTGRYNSANYTVPSAAFPRSAPGDPNFANVELLFGFEQSDPVIDESGNGYTVNLTNTGDPNAYDVASDAQGKFAVVDEATPLDYTYIAADFLFAEGTLTVDALPTATETVTLGSTTYEFVSSLTSANDVLIGADVNETIDNLVAAINGGAGEGSVYGTGTVANTAASAENLGGNQMRAVAATQGTAGNSVASTETMADAAWTGSTLSGGADIPAAQEFSFSPLPLDTTAVRGVQLYHRSAKSDAGPCNLQTSFHVGASSSNGTDRPITTAFSYWTDIWEEDPDTSAGLTPNSLTAGAFQINRTT